MKCVFIACCVFFSAVSYGGSHLYIPMDSVGQTNHLKAYGIAFAALKKGVKVDWLLNFKGGSFAMEYSESLMAMCKERDVSYVKISDKEYNRIVDRITSKDYNGDIVHLEKVPKIAVYTPPNKEPWDDAVTLALTYAEIPFEKIYADDVLAGRLSKFDWLHIHHEDFTGQFSKFWAGYNNTLWYINDQKTEEEIAHRNGFLKVSQLELAVVKKIRDFVYDGGNMFAMCLATETFDIALAANGIDICDSPIDGDPADSNAQSKLDFSQCLAFNNFVISRSLYENVHSDIDNTFRRQVKKDDDYFKLSKFNAKINPVPALLCQDHSRIIKGFMGKTTAFRNKVLKPGVVILADFTQQDESKYIHGEYGKGTWTFYGGHDPEDYEHRVGAEPTDLSKHCNSPGYRLILNNVLFPGAKSKTIQAVVFTNTVTPAHTDTVVADTISKTEPEQAADESEIVLSRVILYPNPSNNELIISMPTNTPTGKHGNNISKNDVIRKVVVLNNSGKIVLEKNFNADKVSIFLSDFSPGVYFVKVNGIYAGSIVKE